jgi:hypothetical protein
LPLEQLDTFFERLSLRYIVASLSDANALNPKLFFLHSTWNSPKIIPEFQVRSRRLRNKLRGNDCIIKLSKSLLIQNWSSQQYQGSVGFWRRSNLRISEGIASGEEQERPRKDRVGRRVAEYLLPCLGYKKVNKHGSDASTSNQVRGGRQTPAGFQQYYRQFGYASSPLHSCSTVPDRICQL